MDKTEKFKTVFNTIGKNISRSSRTLNQVENIRDMVKIPKNPNETRLGNLGKAIGGYALDRSPTLRRISEVKDMLKKKEEVTVPAANSPPDGKRQSAALRYLQSKDNQYIKSLHSIQTSMQGILSQLSNQDDVFKKMLKVQEESGETAKSNAELKSVSRSGAGHLLPNSLGSSGSHVGDASQNETKAGSGGLIGNLLKSGGYALGGVLLANTMSSLKGAVSKAGGKIAEAVKPKPKVSSADSKIKLDTAKNAAKVSQEAADATKLEAQNANKLARETADASKGTLKSSTGKTLSGTADAAKRAALERRAIATQIEAERLSAAAAETATVAAEKKVAADTLAKSLAKFSALKAAPEILGKVLMTGIKGIMSGPALAAQVALDPSDLGDDTTIGVAKRMYTNEISNMGSDGKTPDEINKFINSKSSEAPEVREKYLASNEHKTAETTAIANAAREKRNIDRKRAMEVGTGIPTTDIPTSFFSDGNRDRQYTSSANLKIRETQESLLNMFKGIQNQVNSTTSAPTIIAPVTNNYGGATNINNGGNVTAVTGGGTSSLDLPQMKYNLPSLVW